MKQLGEWIAILEAASEKTGTKLELAKARGDGDRSIEIPFCDGGVMLRFTLYTDLA